MKGDNMKERFSKLLEVKSLVTLAMTAALIALLFSKTAVDDGVKNLFCTAYGAVITYFFTRKSDGDAK
jgi:hypothetical protein